MKTTSILSAVLTSAAVASAQVKYEDGKYICEQENAAYCAGDSLGTDIIIRCNGKVGQPGRCSDNLAGQPPLGVHPARCWQTSPTSGDAACEKNCVVYGSSGNYPGTFTLPADVCTPTYTATPTSSATSSSSGPGGTATTITTKTTQETETICPPTITETITPPSSTNSSSSKTRTSKTPLPSTCVDSTATTLTSLITTTTSSKTTASTKTTSAATTVPTNSSGRIPNGSGSGTSGTSTSTRTGGGGPVVTAGAAVNHAAGALVALGGVAVLWF